MLGPYPEPLEETQSPFAPTWRLEQLARARALKVRVAVAASVRCPAAVLVRLAPFSAPLSG